MSETTDIECKAWALARRRLDFYRPACWQCVAGWGGPLCEGLQEQRKRALLRPPEKPHDAPGSTIGSEVGQ